MCPTSHTLLQCKPRRVILHFNTLLPLFVTAKSVKVYGLWKMFLPASYQHKFLTAIILLTTNNIILMITLLFFPKASYGVFHIH